jgi:hypothetical protein
MALLIDDPSSDSETSGESSISYSTHNTNR